MTEKQAANMATIISTRGYLVITSYNRYEIGHVIRVFTGGPGGELINHPMVVIAVTDKADYQEQLKLIGQHRDGYKYFYRCITD